MMQYLRIGITALILMLCIMCWYLWAELSGAKTEADRNKKNTEVLMSDVRKYKTSDSLNAASVESLMLTLKQYEDWRSEDLATIKTLKTKADNLASSLKHQSAQEYNIQSVIRDTVIIVDSVAVPMQKVSCGDEWYSFEGVFNSGNFSGKMETRDYILVAEFIKYKRFLGFLWKTRRIKERRIEIVSKNPHSKITDVEFVKFTDKDY